MLRFFGCLILLVSSVQCTVGSQNPCNPYQIEGPYIKPVTISGNNSMPSAQSWGACGTPLSYHILWYSIEPIQFSTIEISTCFANNSFTALISPGPKGPSTPCDSLCFSTTFYDNIQNCTNGQKTSWTATDTQYLIAIWNPVANGVFSMTVSETPTTSTNGTGCSKAQEIPGPYNEAVTVSGNTKDSPGGTICNSVISHADWYTIEVAVGDSIMVSTCSPDTQFPVQLYIISGTCVNPFCLDLANNLRTCSGSNCITDAVQFQATESSYFIVVTGKNNTVGQYLLSVKLVSDYCDTVLPVTLQMNQNTSVTGSTAEGFPMPTRLPFCGTNTKIHTPSVWYLIIPPDGYDGEKVIASSCTHETDYLDFLMAFSGPQCGTNLVCVTVPHPEFCYHKPTIAFTLSKDYETFLVVTGVDTKAGDYGITFSIE